MRHYQAFCKGILPLLIAIEDYLSASIEDKTVLDQKKETISDILQSNTRYPEWVFAIGFNPALRAGFRFFLIKLDWLIEILFSYHYLFFRTMSDAQFVSLHDIIFDTIKKNKELVEITISVFSGKNVKETNTDYTTDIEQLEKAIHPLLPKHLQLLAISPDEEALAAFSRHIKDMRKILLELVAALPAAE